MADIPKLEIIKEETRKKCGFCEQKVKPGDMVLSYVSSAYAGHVNYRWMHMHCLLDASGKDLGFEAILMAMGRDGGKKK